MKLWLIVPGDWLRPRDESTFTVYRCASCGFGQISPRPTPDAVTSFYEIESYYTHGSRATFSSNEPLTFAERLILKLAWENDRGALSPEDWVGKTLPRDTRVCDLGCGDGSLLANRHGLGYDVVGIEPDAAACRVASEKGLTVFRGSAEALPAAPLGGAKFGCVVMSHVLEHCLDPKKAVSNAAGLLEEGGVLVIETPNNDAKGLDQMGLCWPFLDVPRHLNFFTGDSLDRICADAGMSVRTVEYRSYVRQFSRDWLASARFVGRFFAERAERLDAEASPNRDPNAWSLLLATAWSAAKFKYDSVLVQAVRSPK